MFETTTNTTTTSADIDDVHVRNLFIESDTTNYELRDPGDVRASRVATARSCDVSPNKSDASLATIEGLSELIAHFDTTTDSSSLRFEGKTAQQIGDTLVNALEQVSKRVLNVENRQMALGRTIKSELGIRDDQLTDVSRVLEVHYNAIKWLVSRTDVLHGAALGIPSFQDALVVRSHLDRARHTIAWAFMEVFPKFMLPEKITFQFSSGDLQDKDIDWKKFKEQLGQLYSKFHVTKKNFPSPHICTLYQDKSCMDIAELTDNRFDEFLNSPVETDTLIPPVEPGTLNPSNKLYTLLLDSYKEAPKWVGESDVRQQLKGEDRDATVRRRINFFIPIMAYEYSKARSSLLIVNQKITSEQQKILVLRNSITAKWPARVPLSSFGALPECTPGNDESDCFQTGTGMLIRADETWKDNRDKDLRGFTESYRSSNLKVGKRGNGGQSDLRRVRRRRHVRNEPGTSRDLSARAHGNEGFYTTSREFNASGSGDVVSLGKRENCDQSDFKLESRKRRHVRDESRMSRDLNARVHGNEGLYPTSSSSSARWSHSQIPALDFGTISLTGDASRSRERQNVFSVAKPEQEWQIVGMTLFTEMQNAEDRLNLFLIKRQEILSRRDCLRKFLDIVLDEQIYRMAVDANDKLRIITNDYAHLKKNLVKYSRKIVDVGELFVAAEEPPPEDNLQKHLQRLICKLYDEEANFPEEVKRAGVLVDNHIMEHIEECPLDVKLLLLKLDDLEVKTHKILEPQARDS